MAAHPARAGTRLCARRGGSGGGPGRPVAGTPGKCMAAAAGDPRRNAGGPAGGERLARTRCRPAGPASGPRPSSTRGKQPLVAACARGVDSPGTPAIAADQRGGRCQWFRRDGVRAASARVPTRGRDLRNAGRIAAGDHGFHNPRPSCHQTSRHPLAPPRSSDRLCLPASDARTRLAKAHRRQPDGHAARLHRPSRPAGGRTGRGDRRGRDGRVEHHARPSRARRPARLRRRRDRHPAPDTRLGRPEPRRQPRDH